MWFRLLEMFFSPFAIIVLTYNWYNPSSPQDNGSKPTENSKPQLKENASFVNRSAIECPLASERSVPLLFYDHPDSEIRGCYEEEGRKPCGEYMKLYRINETRNGECDCDVSSKRILIYHSETQRCYPIFQQGYCEDGEQLMLTRENQFVVPACQKTACVYMLKNPENKGKDLVPFNRNTICVQVGSECTPGHIVTFERNKATPSCIHRRSASRSLGVPAIRCNPGTYAVISGHCQPDYSFDWD